MIPPVEERAIRLCSGCINLIILSHGCAECRLDKSGSAWNDRVKECQNTTSCEYASRKYPCKYNIRYVEVDELIESGVIE
jgi:hypothetical protein